jgi:endonuclease/exonuclease/phosphatase family metal-dependent hydrolase
MSGNEHSRAASVQVGRRRIWLKRTIVAASALLLAVVLSLWMVLEFAVDATWFGTLVAFGPRWILAFPLGALFFVATKVSRAATAILTLSAVIFVGPVLDVRFPFRAGTQPPSGGALRIATYNAARLPDPGILQEVAEGEGVALIACQEWPPTAAGRRAIGNSWHSVTRGGLLIASQHPVGFVGELRSAFDPWRTVALACELQLAGRSWRIVCVHLATPRPGLDAVRQHGLAGTKELDRWNRLRSDESRRVRTWCDELDADIVLGDFNMVESSVIYRRDWGTRTNAFAIAPSGLGWTKVTPWLGGVRIDHILCDRKMSVQRATLSPAHGSDHRPLVASIGLSDDTSVLASQ